MTQWWNKHFTNFLKERVSLRNFDAMLFSSNFYFRHGTDSLLADIVPRYKIPLFVVSAGLGTLIQESLKHLLGAKLYSNMLTSQ